MTISDKPYRILIQGDTRKTILGGLWVTIQISALALRELREKEQKQRRIHRRASLRSHGWRRRRPFGGLEEKTSRIRVEK